MPPTHTDDGLRAAREIRDELPDDRRLVLSQYAEEGYALDLVAEGPEGVGYLLKDRIAEMDRFVDVGTARRRGRLGARPGGRVVAGGPQPQRGSAGQLSAREREVLELMAEGRSNSSVAEHLEITERAVEKHITSIFVSSTCRQRQTTTAACWPFSPFCALNFRTAVT